MGGGGRETHRGAGSRTWMEGLAPKVRVTGPWAAPGLARPSWCCTRAMAAMALTTAAPMSCSRMSSHCVVAQEANWHRWFSSRSRWFSSSNLGEAERPHHCCTDLTLPRHPSWKPAYLLPAPPYSPIFTLPECPLPAVYTQGGQAPLLLTLPGTLPHYRPPTPDPRPRLWLGDAPVSGPCSPEHGEACQGVSQVGVERGQGEAAQAPQLPEGRPVVTLHPVVEEAQRRQQQQQPGQAGTQHDQEAQQAYGIGQQDVEEEGQAVVHTGYI